MTLEQKFNQDMRNIYILAKKECGYNATRFLQLLSSKGGVAAAKQLIRAPGGTEGFETLLMCGRLDLSVEAHVIKPEYSSLFAPEDIERCKSTLKELNYPVEP